MLFKTRRNTTEKYNKSKTNYKNTKNIPFLLIY